MHYIYFGCQCPGMAMDAGGREAANILGLKYTVSDAAKNPDLARAHEMFFPGILVCGDLKLVYPGSGAQLAESIRIGGPIPGRQEYRQLPEKNPDRVEILGPHNLGDIHGLCIPKDLAPHWCMKENWLKAFALPCLGVIAYHRGQPVAVMETLPRERVPYPLPEYQGLFVTCLYGRYDSTTDYRRGLIEAGLPLLKRQGYSSIGIVAGRDTPYPNGPVDMLAQAGFQVQKTLGKVILRHRWEEQVFMAKTL